MVVDPSEEEDILSMHQAPFGMTYLPVLPEQEDCIQGHTGVSHTRAAIVNYVKEYEITRPPWNVLKGAPKNKKCFVLLLVMMLPGNILIQLNI